MAMGEPISGGHVAIYFDAPKGSVGAHRLDNIVGNLTLPPEAKALDAPTSNSGSLMAYIFGRGDAKYTVKVQRNTQADGGVALASWRTSATPKPVFVYDDENDAEGDYVPGFAWNAAIKKVGHENPADGNAVTEDFEIVRRSDYTAPGS